MRPRYVVALGPDDVGSRVVLRYRLHDGSGQQTDVLGELVTWTTVAITVRRADGAEVSVLPADVVAAKRIPDPPVRPSG